MRRATPLPEIQQLLMLSRPEAGAVVLTTRPLRPPGPEEALLKLIATAICGTDLHIIRWNGWARSAYKPPLALGHELCAEVLAVGADVHHVHPGDRVVAETHLSCGHCRQCRANRRHTCENLSVFSRLDRGAFADYTVVPAALLRHVPPELPSDIASLSEPFGIAVRAALAAGVAGKVLLVTGCGPIGLMVITVAHHLGAHRVIAADRVTERLALAEAVGADETIDVGQQDLASALASRPVDVAVDASGAASAITAALASIAPGGELLLTGLPEVAVSLDLARHVILREVAIRGLYGRLIDESWLAAERLLSNSRFSLAPLITHRFALEDFEAAFACALSGKAGKVIFDNVQRDP